MLQRVAAEMALASGERVEFGTWLAVQEQDYGRQRSLFFQDPDTNEIEVRFALVCQLVIQIAFSSNCFFPGSYRSRDVTSICGKVAAWFRWSHGDRLALETKSTWHDQRVIKNWHNGTCWNVETCLASPSNHSLPSKEPVLAVLPHSTSSHWRWCWAGRKC